MKRLIVIMIVFSLLVGCGSTRVEKQVVYKKETKIAVPNSDMTRDCSITPNYDKESFSSQSQDKREDMLTDLVINLYKDLGNCNIQMENLRNWFPEQEKLYNKKDQ